MKDINEILSIAFDKDINEIKLTEVQRKIKNVSDNKNVLVVSSCGSGKTEVAYYLSKLWDEKFIYVLPMKTLATSIYERLNKYEDKFNKRNLNNKAKHWTIQHSNIMEDKFLANELCVTTIDQVLSGYLGIGVQSFIRGKNVVNSDIVFDEIQLFEPGKTLKTTIMMLDSLYKQGNRFCIMTATMPKSLIDFLSTRYDMEVIITDKPSVENRQVNIRYEKELSLEALNSYEHKQIIICNTQREQEKISNLIEDKERIILLNSKMLNSDRKKVEKEVFKYFGKGSEDNNKVLVSTQILEAGMDISADKLYSALAPIDNLVQRDGRCCRWGGNGEFIVFCSEDSFVYDEEACKRTEACIRANNGCVFSWSVQKEWISEILNEFYSNQIREQSLKRFKMTLRGGSRKNLIRDIDNVNLIVSNNTEVNISDFYRESVSISLSLLKKLSTNNKIFIIEKQKYIKEVPFNKIKIGETCIIQGRDCVYDKIGFRFLKDGLCNSFKCEIPEINSTFERFNYVKEPWIYHALGVKNIFKLKMSNEKRFKLSREEIERYSFIAGLHDLGKCSKNWQKYIGANQDEILAHNSFEYRNFYLIKDFPHKYISALLLYDYLDNFEINLLTQHHGRLFPNDDILEFSNINLHKKIEEKLYKYYGFNSKLHINGEDIFFKDKNIYSPNLKDWCKFLRIVGTIMESDIQAIKDFQENNLIYIG